MARLSSAAAAAALTLVLPVVARAQNLGGYRQFLSIEPYYINVQRDNGSDASVRYSGLNGYGARLWINYAPFVKSRALAKGGIALFAHTATDAGYRVVHYGAEQDVFFVNRPLGGFFDPLISVGAGAYRRSVDAQTVLVSPSSGTVGTALIPGVHTTKFALTPGVGFRVPVPNRLQLRFDARDAILFNQDVGARKATLHNLEFTGALGITF